MQVIKGLTLLAVCVVAHASGASAQVIIAPGARLQNRGVWQREGEASKQAQRWEVQARRLADNRIEGTIVLQGSPLLSRGQVRGRLLGTFVSGEIFDESGEVAVQFRGQVRANGEMFGTYVDRTGETGEWRWDGNGAPASSVLESEAAGATHEQLAP